MLIDEDRTPMVILLDDNGQPKLDTQGNAIMIPGKQPKELQGITFKGKMEFYLLPGPYSFSPTFWYCSICLSCLSLWPYTVPRFQYSTPLLSPADLSYHDSVARISG